MKFQEKKKNETAVSQGVLATAALSREKGLARVEGVKGVASQSQEVLSSIFKSFCWPLISANCSFII